MSQLLTAVRAVPGAPSPDSDNADAERERSLVLATLRDLADDDLATKRVTSVGRLGDYYCSPVRRPVRLSRDDVRRQGRAWAV